MFGYLKLIPGNVMFGNLKLFFGNVESRDVMIMFCNVTLISADVMFGLSNCSPAHLNFVYVKVFGNVVLRLCDVICSCSVV